MSLENNIERIADSLERIATVLEGNNAPKSVADTATTQAGSTVTPPSAPAASAPTPPTPPAQSPAAPAPETTNAPSQASPSAPTPPTPPAPAAEVPPSPPVSQAAATSTAVTAAPPANLDANALNEALRIEWQRLGGTREPIDTVMRDQFGVNSITDLKAEQYQPLLDAVRAVKAV